MIGTQRLPEAPTHERAASPDCTALPDHRADPLPVTDSAAPAAVPFAELLASSREYVGRFDYDSYPVCFEAFRQKAGPFFDRLAGLQEAEASALADRLIAELAAEYGALPRREQKATLQQVRQVLALFFTPAAEKHSPEAQHFAAGFRERWSRQFPGYSYLPGNYEKLMEGFAFNRMGLPLLKARRRRS